MPQAAKPHWTQRPENKDRLRALGKSRWSGASKNNTSSLVSEWEALKVKVDQRLKEIEESIKTLSEERDEISKLLS